jgi:predicted phage replisome organizer
MSDEATPAQARKYYWLKLRRDFFKRHDIRIVEEMENGKDYLLFYMKLLVESIDHEGALRFSETIPYNDRMLASITNTNIDIVRGAIKLFAELGMLEMMDDGTLFMSQVTAMLGHETQWAAKKRLYREKRKELPEDNVLALSDKSIELELELEIENKSKRKRSPATQSPNTKKRPTAEEINAYCKERGISIDAEAFIDYYETVGWLVGKARTPMHNWRSAVNNWEKNDRRYGRAAPSPRPEPEKLPEMSKESLDARAIIMSKYYNKE